MPCYLRGMTKTPRSWTQLLDCELARKAREQMERNPALTYHNWDHVTRCVWHAEHTFEFPFDLALGKAILTHDVIYDGKPQAEWRSAEWLFENDGETKTNIEAARHIMKTAGHAVTDDNRMVFCDLGDFLYPQMTHDNFYKVMMESVNLYKVPAEQITATALEFLEKMHRNYADNILATLNPPERIAFLGIRTGIERVIMFYEEAQKGAKRAGK